MIKLKDILSKGKLNEFDAKMQKNHFLNLIKQELESKKGQLKYSEDKIRYRMTPKWERKEWLEVAKDLRKDIKNIEKNYKRVQKLKERKLNEDKSLAYFIHIGYDIFDSIHKLDKEIKQHSVAKKDGKIKKIIKGLYKLESDLGEAINDLNVPDSNRG